MKTRQIIKALASIKLGVVIIVLIGILTAWGTLIEAHYNDAAAAQKLVYNSIWMYSTMAALVICLIAVMIDRWPWQKRHTGFVLAHIGIIVMLLGALLTRYFGIDGSIVLEPGGSSRFVAINETVMGVYATLGPDSDFRKIGEKQVDFFLNRPSEARPSVIPLAGGDIKIVEFLPYAFRDEKVMESRRATAGAAIRFQLQNDRVSLTEWLVQPGLGREVSKNLGPAQVILTAQKDTKVEGRNAIVLRTIEGTERFEYAIHTARDPANVKRGKIGVGESLETGWMGLVLRMLKFVPHAEEVVTYKATEQATPMTVPAVRFQFGDHDYWLGLNSMARLFTDQSVYVVTYENAKLALDFDLSLKEFRVGRYPGTVRAASYESQVMVPGAGEVTISMNEPLKHRGYTFYQASFQEDEQRRPIASILSVNKDPGRWIKYLGSLLIVMGTIHLFYFRRKSAAQKR